ncbi:MAG TPA: hypothetical protein VFE01_05335 [Terracidiphilus sp.]|jgi:hypothetical protein|nr:hypothetical protein [Terracidiphilus sp.]
MIDLAKGLELLGTEEVTEEIRDVLPPFLMKTDKDRRHLMLRSGLQHLLDDGKLYAEQSQSLEPGMRRETAHGSRWAARDPIVVFRRDGSVGAGESLARFQLIQSSSFPSFALAVPSAATRTSPSLCRSVTW